MCFYNYMLPKTCCEGRGEPMQNLPRSIFPLSIEFSLSWARGLFEARCTECFAGITVHVLNYSKTRMFHDECWWDVTCKCVHLILIVVGWNNLLSRVLLLQECKLNFWLYSVIYLFNTCLYPSQILNFPRSYGL